MRRHGPLRAAFQAAHRIVRTAQRRRTGSAEREFDAFYDVETTRIVQLDDLEIPSENARFGIAYDPIDPDLLRRTLAALPLDVDGFTFVDLGSGKGRALIVASEFPFRGVVGVEFSPELHADAERNVATMRRDRQRSGPIESILMDAVDYDYPEGDVAVHLFSPFEGPVLEAVLNRLRARGEQRHDATLVIFCGSVPGAVTDDAAFERIALTPGGSSTGAEGRKGVVYRLRAPGEPSPPARAEMP